MRRLPYDQPAQCRCAEGPSARRLYQGGSGSLQPRRAQRSGLSLRAIRRNLPSGADRFPAFGRTGDLYRMGQFRVQRARHRAVVPGLPHEVRLPVARRLGIDSQSDHPDRLDPGQHLSRSRKRAAQCRDRCAVPLDLQAAQFRRPQRLHGRDDSPVQRSDGDEPDRSDDQRHYRRAAVARYDGATGGLRNRRRVARIGGGKRPAARNRDGGQSDRAQAAVGGRLPPRLSRSACGRRGRADAMVFWLHQFGRRDRRRGG